MKLLIVFSCSVLAFFMFNSVQAQEKKVAEIKSISPELKKTEASTGNQNVSYDENGKLKLETDQRQQNKNNYIQQLSFILEQEFTTVIDELASTDVSYYDAKILEIENQISTIKSNPLELDLAITTGKMQELELRLQNFKSRRLQLILNK